MTERRLHATFLRPPDGRGSGNFFVPGRRPASARGVGYTRGRSPAAFPMTELPDAASPGADLPGAANTSEPALALASLGGRPRRRGIYLLPNLLTTGGLFAGYFAIVAAIGGRYVTAAIAIFVAGLLDGIDGRVARMTNTQSEFGVQYDSLADLVSFGVAPSLVMFTWSLSTLKALGPAWGKIGWTAAFLYAACAALRLARFNTQVEQQDKRFFQGLASPAAAGFMMSFVWVANDYGFAGHEVAWVALGVTLAAALLMVSRVRYLSFKSNTRSDRVPFVAVLIALGVLVAIAVEPPTVLFGIAILYVASGLALTIWGMRRWRGRRDPAKRDIAARDGIAADP